MKLVAEKLGFPESPRWHDGRLWFSDMALRRIFRVGTDGKVDVVTEVPERPSGLGWMPDGTLLVVSVEDRKLMRLTKDGSLTEAADMSGLHGYRSNDLVVDSDGRAYAGSFGFDYLAGAEMKTAPLVRVNPGGKAEVAAPDLLFANGMVIPPDGRTLLVAETYGGCITAFDRGSDGALSNRRVFAKLEGVLPDGICLDAEGCVWAANPIGQEVVRIREGEGVIERLPVDGSPLACMLGGEDRRTLFICATDEFDWEAAATEKTGRIFATQASVAGAGLP